MKFLLTTFLLTFFIGAFAQVPKNVIIVNKKDTSYIEPPKDDEPSLPIFSGAKLPNLKDVVWQFGFATGLDYDIYNLEKSDTTMPISAKGCADAFDDYIKSSKPHANLPLLKKNSGSIKKMLNGFNYFGDGHHGSFFCHLIKFPVQFATNVDGGLTLAVSPFYDDNVYNTLRNSAKQRAAKVIQDYILPALSELKDSYTNAGIKYFSFSTIFGSKDFSNPDNILNLKSEYVNVVASYANIKIFLDSQITEQQFISMCDVYSSDRSSPHDIKKDFGNT